MARKIELLETTIDENGHPVSSEVVHPLTSADCVVMENGATLDKVMGDGIATPTVTHESASFQVGVGDSNIEVVDGDVAGMTLEGKSYHNILPKPTTLIMETDEKEFKINDKIDNSIVLNDNVAEIATIKGKTYVNVIQEESVTEYIALGEELSGQSITTTGKPKGYIKNVTLEGSTKYHDIDNDTVLDEFDETKNLELISVNNPKIYATGKNLFDGILAQGYIGDSSGLANTSSVGVHSPNYMKVKPNTSYTRTISGNYPSNITARTYFYDVNKTYLYIYNDGKTFITPENAQYMRFRYYIGGQNITPDDFSESSIQIEEGTTATSYEPYKGVTIEQSIDSIPLTSDMFEQGGIDASSTTATNGMSYKQFPQEGTSANKIKSKTLIPVKPNGRYTINFRGYAIMFDKNGDYVKIGSEPTLNFTNGVEFTIPSNVYYMALCMKNSDNSNITPSSLDSLNLTLQEVTDEIVLRSIGDVKDTLNLTTGEYVQRIKEVVLDGSEQWAFDTKNALPNTIRFYTTDNTFSDAKSSPSNTLNDAGLIDLPTGTSNTDSEHICIVSDRAYIRKNKTEYSDLSIFINWLSSNPITIQYELKTPIIKKVNLTNTTKLPSYTSITHYDTIVPSNSLVPNIKIPSTIDYNVAIKPSTQYTIRANTTSAMSVNLGGSTGTLANGKVTLTTPSELAHNSLKLGNGKVKELMVVEGSEIKDNVPFFNGMKNVQMGGIKLVNIARGAVVNSLVSSNANGTQYTYTSNGSTSWGDLTFDKALLKPNTVYTIYMNIVSNTSDNGIKIQLANGKDGVLNINKGTTGIIKQTIVSAQELVNSDKFALYFRNSSTSGKQVVIQNPMVIEGDWTHLDEIPYIESEMIIEQPIIRSTSEDGVEPFKQHTLSSNRVIGYEENCYYNTANGVKTTQNAINSMLADVEGLSIAYVVGGSSNYTFWDKDDTFISGKQYLDTSLSSYDKNGFITVPSNAKYMRFAAGGETNSQPLYKVATVTGELPLRSLPDGVCDSFNLVTGEYVQRIEEVVLDGDEEWTQNGNGNYGFYITKQDSKPSSTIVCDKLKEITGWNNYLEKGIFRGTQAFGVVVTSNELTTCNVETFKTWLSHNPITVQYELDTPIVRKIGLTAKGNYKEVELNGSEDWISANADANNTICTRYYIPNGESINSVAPNMIVNSPTFSDYIKSRKYQSDSHGQYEYVSVINEGLYLQIYKNKLLQDSVSGFKQWLSQHPMKVGYLTNQSNTTYSNILKPIFFNNVKVQFMNNNVDIQPSLTLQARSRNSYVMDMMKANTRYTLKALANPNPFTIDGTSYSATTNGTFTSPSTLTNKLLITGQDVQELMIIEGDVVNKQLPYYKGIRSSFDNTKKVEVLIQSTDNRENSTIINMPMQLETVEVVRPVLEKGSVLKSSGTLVEDDTMRRPKDFIPVQPNTNLTFMNGNAYRAENVIFYDINKNYMGWLYTDGSGDLVVPDNCYFIKFYSGNTNTNDLVLIKKQHKPIALNELPNGVKDELIINRATSSAKLIRRVGKVVLDGSESWVLNEYHKNTTQFIAHNIIKAKNATRQEVVCDKLQSVTDFYTIVNDSVWIFDSKHLVIHNSSSTSNQLKDWLKQNPITVYYELAEPSITEIRLKGYPFVYEDGSITLNTDIAPVTRTSYNVNQHQLINSQNETIIRHDKQISDLYDYIEIYLDEIYRMELFKMQLELSL